ncbi:MAG: hypothetical protein ABEK36_04020 [Candidatus Aenigmatarchaeota archaeon]
MDLMEHLEDAWLLYLIMIGIITAISLVVRKWVRIENLEQQIQYNKECIERNKEMWGRWKDTIDKRLDSMNVALENLTGKFDMFFELYRRQNGQKED